MTDTSSSVTDDSNTPSFNVTHSNPNQVAFDFLHIHRNHNKSISTSASNTSISSSLNDEHHTCELNEKVAHLATSIYQELEKIVKIFGRDSVKDLMPIVVSILGWLLFWLEFWKIIF
jgi:hypothetical protein